MTVNYKVALVILVSTANNSGLNEQTVNDTLFKADETTLSNIVVNYNINSSGEIDTNSIIVVTASSDSDTLDGSDLKSLFILFN